MKTSVFMAQILRQGFVYCDSIEKVIDIQDESIYQGIMVDYVECVRVDCPRPCYKVFQLGGDE